MKTNFVVFLIRLLIYSVLIYAALLFVAGNLPVKFQYPHPAYLVIFFFVVTAVFHLGMLRSAAKSGTGIIRYFMMATVMKFLLYLVVMIVYGMIKPDRAAAFISNFFTVYALITVFEVSMVYSHFKSKTSEAMENEIQKNPWKPLLKEDGRLFKYSVNKNEAAFLNKD